MVGGSRGQWGAVYLKWGEEIARCTADQFLESAQFAHCETMDANSNKKLPVPGTSVVISVFVVICLCLTNTESETSKLVLYQVDSVTVSLFAHFAHCETMETNS